MRGRDVLLDTGPIVALLLARDQWHERIRPAWPDLVDRCITSEAVVTEACHLVAQRGGTAALVIEFLLAAEIPVMALHLPGHQHCAHILRRYQDQDMDYGDASLVVLADAFGLHRVFTTDRRGFETFRAARGERFALLPA